MAEKNNKGILLTVVVAVAALVGVGAFFLTQDKGEQPAEMAAAETPTDAAQESAQTEAAAGDSAQNVNPQAAAANVPPPEGIQVEPGNPVVAKVGDKPITRVDVYRFIQTMPANVQQLPAAAVYPMAMEQVINTRIVQNKAQDADIETSEAFQQELLVAKQQLARNVYLEQEVGKRLSEDKLKEAYDEYVKNIPEVEERRARHILVETEDKAKAVIDRLDKGGNFEELAKELSTGPTGENGGDLGYFAQGEMVPEFSEKVFSMKKGDTTKEPVQTQFGFHVVKLEDVRQRPAPSYEQLKPAIEAEVRRAILTELLQDWRKNTEV
ncbi:MAG: peptidylprolyl isomerase, partial [Pseudomonadota bacterium]